MVLRMPIASRIEDSTVATRVATVVAAAVDHLALPLPDLPASALGGQLDNVRHRLEQRIALSQERAEDSVASSQHLVSILRLRCELLDNDLSRRMRSLSEIRNAMAQLRGLPPREMIYAAAVVLSQELAFERTMVSTVRGSLWLPEHLHIEEGAADSHTQRFIEYVRGAQIKLADAPLEADLVRKRSGAFVPCPTADKRTFKEIVEVSGCFGYVVAPITVQGRVIGMLHADRPAPHGTVTMDHLHQLEAFAECLSVAFESAVLEQKACQQRAEVDNLRANVDGLPLLPTSGAFGEGRHDAHYSCDYLAGTSLTSREREIMSHVATGATNAQIARYLVISEGTVKSHLKHIAKKLNTSSRAAAVAVFTGIATADGRSR